MEDTNIQAKKSFLSSKEIVRSARKFYKENFKKLWLLYILGGLGGIGSSFGSSNSSSSHNTDSNSLTGFNMPSWGWTLIAIAGVLLVLLAIFLFISKIALLKGISDTHKGQFVGVRDSYKKTFAIFWSFVLIAIMISWSVLGASFLLIIPGIILSVYLSFAIYELIDKQKKGFQALLGSWSLVKGHWWTLIGKNIMIGLRIFVRGLLYSLAILILVLLLIVPGMVFNIPVLLIAGISLGILAFLCVSIGFLTPLLMIAMFELYYSFCDVKGSEVADEVLDKKRKRKLVFCMWLAPALLVISLIIATILISLGHHS